MGIYLYFLTEGYGDGPFLSRRQFICVLETTNVNFLNSQAIM